MKNKNIIDISDFIDVETQQMVMLNLVERFKLRRKEYGVTQKKLSQISGVSYASIRRFETTGEISLTSLLKLSDAIGILSDFNWVFKNPIIKDIRG